MPVTIDGNKVVVTEVDKWHRYLTWTYECDSYHRAILPADFLEATSEPREVGPTVFAGAFWREWKKERGI